MIVDKPVNLAAFNLFHFSDPAFRGLVTVVGRFWGIGQTAIDEHGHRYAGWTQSSYLCLLQLHGTFRHIEIRKGHRFGGNVNEVRDCGPCTCDPCGPVGRIRLSLAG